MKEIRRQYLYKSNNYSLSLNRIPSILALEWNTDSQGGTLVYSVDTSIYTESWEVCIVEPYLVYADKQTFLQVAVPTISTNEIEMLVVQGKRMAHFIESENIEKLQEQLETRINLLSNLHSRADVVITEFENYTSRERDRVIDKFDRILRTMEIDVLTSKIKYAELIKNIDLTFSSKEKEEVFAMWPIKAIPLYEAIYKLVNNNDNN